MRLLGRTMDLVTSWTINSGEPLMTMSKPVRSWLRITAPLAALVAMLTLAAPAWAGTVQIQDDAHVLNATTVQTDAATLPVGVYIWTTTQDAASKPTFNTDVTKKISATFPVVIGINTQARHESIQIGPRAGLSQSAAVSAASTANEAFVGTMGTSNDYTAAVTSALDSLRTSLAPTDRERGVTRSTPAQSSGWGIVPIVLLVIGVIVVVVLVVLILIGRRRVLGPRPRTHDRH
jgi:cobalamin biosynthesis Mg chelatase CobN